MSSDARPLTIGFPRMHKEPSERRDFLPPLIGLLSGMGAEVYVESGIGSDMGYADEDYLIAPNVHVTDEATAYAPGRRDRASGARGQVRPAAARSDPHLDAPLPHPPGAGPDAARAGDRRDLARLDRERRGPAARREPAQRRLERDRVRVRRPRAAVARRSSSRAGRPSTSRSWAPGASAGTRWSSPRSTATTRATSCSCARGSRASRWSRRAATSRVIPSTCGPASR